MSLDDAAAPVVPRVDKDAAYHDGELPSPRAARLAWWFGGRHTVIGPRIAPVLPHLRSTDGSDSDDSASTILSKQKELEDGRAIQYRTCSWQKARFDSPGGRGIE